MTEEITNVTQESGQENMETEGNTNMPDKKQVYRNWYEIASWVLMLVLAVLAAKGINKFLICNAVVPTGSMETTIMPGDRIFGNRLSYLFSDPKRGDIVVFQSPLNEQKLLVKRIIGIPGDTVVISKGQVYLNGSEEPLEEPYLKDEEWVVENDGYTFEVPEGTYLMLGDNRNNSEDARYWEKQYRISPYVDRKAIRAKANLVYWPLSDFGRLK